MTELSRRATAPRIGGAVAATCALGLVSCGNPAETSLLPPEQTVVSAPQAVAAPAAPAAAGQRQVADPIRVQVPRLDISAAMQPLHLGQDEVLVPPEYGRAGWYQEGPEPGEPGRAVIAGHVDSKSGPDVFAALRNARVGDRIVINTTAGNKILFRVDDVGLFRRSAFPSARVYGGGQTVQLRLITCGGAYDRNRGGYQSNVVVFATLEH